MCYLVIACYAWAAVGCFSMGMCDRQKYIAYGHQPPSIVLTSVIAVTWPLAAFMFLLHMCGVLPDLE